MDKERLIIAYNVIHFRTEKGFSQNDLSEKSLLSIKTINNIEHQKINPSLDTLSRIAQALDCQTYELLQGPDMKRIDNVIKDTQVLKLLINRVVEESSEEIAEVLIEAFISGYSK